MAVGAWVRYSATFLSLFPSHSCTLLFLGQFFTGLAQPWFQVLGPKYSELWFDLKGRTTATAIIAIANPIGGALGELLAPLVSDIRKGVSHFRIESCVSEWRLIPDPDTGID